jgi:hypothetical protein
MSNAFASALEISAQIIRENLTCPATARRLITERMHSYSEESARANPYLMNMQEGFKAVLAGMYAIAQRGER